MKERNYNKHANIECQRLFKFYSKMYSGIRLAYAINFNKRHNKTILLLKKKLSIKYQEWNNHWVKKDEDIRTLWLNRQEL